MAKYHTKWLDYRLPNGHEFSVAVCGYNGKIRHMTIENDFLRRLSFTEVQVVKKKCGSSEHCLALSCPLNNTEPEHLAHMLDMWVDEPLDAENSELWQTESMVDAFVKFAERMNEALPEELRKKQKPIRNRHTRNTL